MRTVESSRHKVIARARLIVGLSRVRSRLSPVRSMR